MNCRRSLTRIPSRRSRGPTGAGIGLAALVALAACGSSSPAPESAAAPSVAPVNRIRATVVLEPPQLKVGDVVSAQIAVVTPPDHRLLPVNPPEVAGVWLLDATTEEVLRGAARWVHRTQIRLRTRDVGRLVWPAFNVIVADSEGAEHSVAVAERVFEVVSVLGDFPTQTNPFGLRSPEPTQGPGGFWLGAGAGAVGALALAAAAFGFYRARDRVPPESEAAKHRARERETTLSDWAVRGLAQATGRLDSKDSPEGPRDAANQAARLLRQFVARRFNLQTEALTTEELAATKPPLAIDSRWPELLRILRRFDAERFRQARFDTAAAARIRGEIEAVERFVHDSIPPELRR